MIKVMMVSEEGRGGGALYRINNIALETKGKIETVIVMPGIKEDHSHGIMGDGLEVKYLKLRPLTISTFGLIKYLVFFPIEIWQLSRIVVSQKPDIIHANGAWQIKGVIVSWLKGIKCIWHMNDTRQHPVVKVVFRLLSKIPKAYIFASKRTHNYYKKNILGTKFLSQIIPAPVDTDRIFYANRRFENNRLKLVTVGYINKNKGLDFLLETANLLKDEEIEFHVIGPTLESQRYYMRQIREKKKKLGLDKVHFPGYKNITTEELKDYDVYFCSSTNEASPTSVWEAMASGLPIISTDVGDVKEVIEQYSCGFILPEQTSLEASKSIISFLKMNPKTYAKLSVNSRKVAEELFDRKSVAKDYLRFYSEVMSEGKN